jgi:transposase InsO family protein
MQHLELARDRPQRLERAYH